MTDKYLEIWKTGWKKSLFIIKRKQYSKGNKYRNNKKETKYLRIEMQSNKSLLIRRNINSKDCNKHKECIIKWLSWKLINTREK